MRKLAAAIAVLWGISVSADTETVNGITWSYMIDNDGATIGIGAYYDYDAAPAISQTTTGAITVPSQLGGYRVTSIGNYAFVGCTGLTSVTIPDGVTSIGDSAFSGCSGLASVTIPDSVTSIAYGAFIDTPFYENQPDGLVVLGKVAYRIKGSSCPSSVTIPDGVTSICDGLFGGCYDLTSVTIPDSVTSIGDSAFSYCNIETITVPGRLTAEGKGMTSIGTAAFLGCENLKSVTIGNGVTNIGNAAFIGCSALESARIYGNVGSLMYAFQQCTNLTEVILGEGMSEIGIGAFVECTSLKNIDFLPDGAIIGFGAFSECGFTDLTIPAGVKEVLGDAFYSCGNLENITIPDGSATRFYDSAFGRCTNLTSVAIGCCTAEIHTGAFAGCSRLRSFSVAADNPKYVSSRGLLLSKNGQTLVAGINGDVKIPDSVTCITNDAFVGLDGLTRVTIPDSVTSIGSYAFSGCSGLTNLIFEGDAPVVNESAFDEVGNNCTAYVRRDSTGWGVAIPGTWKGMRIEYLDEATLELLPEYMTFTGSEYYGNGTYGVLDALPVVSSGATVRISYDLQQINDALGSLWGSGDSVEVVLFQGNRHTERTAPIYTHILSVLAVNAFPSSGVFEWGADVQDGRYIVGFVLGDLGGYCVAYGREIYIGTPPEVETHDGFVYEFRIKDGNAEIVSITPTTSFYGSTMNIPSQLGGCPVVSIGEDAWGVWGMGDPYEITTGPEELILQNVILPQGLKRVEAGAFAWGAGNAITFPDTLEYLGFRAVNVLGVGVRGRRLNFYGDVPETDDSCFVPYLEKPDVYVTHRYAANWNAFLTPIGLSIAGYLDEGSAEVFSVSFGSGVHGTLSGTSLQSITNGCLAVAPDVIVENGYRFVGWSGDVTAPIVSNATFTAQYEAIPYAITYTGLKGATNPNLLTYTVEDEVVFAAPGDVYGWVFKGWTPASIAPGGIGDVEVAANWERAKFDVTVNGETRQYSYEDEVTFTAPGPWDADGMQVVTLGTTFTAPVVTNEFTVAVTNGMEFTWDIVATNWWFDVYETQNGSVLAPEAGWMADGTNFVLTAVPAEHYHFVDWIGDTNGCVTADGTLEVTMDQARTMGAWFVKDAFDVSFKAGEHGMLSGFAAQSVDYGATAAVPEVTPAAGYRFVGWSGDVTAPIVSNATFTAQYEAIPYAITYTGLKGATNPNPLTYTVEDEVVFAAPGEVYGWAFKGWTPASIARGSTGAIETAADWERQKFDVTVNGETRQYSYEDEVTFAAPGPWDADGMQVVTLGTTFTAPVVTNEFTVAVTNGMEFTWDIVATNWWFDVYETQNGSVLAPEAGWMADGTNFVLTAVPAEHYHFVDWIGDTNGCVTADGTLEVTMDQARTMGAWFVKDAFDVSFKAGEHGTLSGFAAQSVDYGATAAVPEVTPAAGYRFVGWSGDVTAPIVSNATFTAQYEAIPYAITYTGLKGAANTNPETYTVEDEIAFAAPGEVYGWAFKGWTPASIARGSTGAIEAAADWERQKFDVTVNGETRQYSYEDEVTFTAPGPWDADGMQVVTLGTTFTDPVVTNMFTATVTNGMSFTWDIVATNWWFDVYETQNGSVLAPEAGWMADGTNFVLTAVPEEHYHFVDWIGDTNGCVTADGTLEVTMDQARTLGAWFEKDAFAVSFDAGVHGTISGVAALSVDYGATAAVPEVIPAAGYRFAGWSGDVSAPVTSNAMFTAQYEAIRYAITYTGLKGAANTNPETYTVEDEIAFAAPGEVYGWAFKGWTPASIARGSTGAIEAAADWERQKFDVTVNGETRQYAYGDDVTFTAPGPWDEYGMQVVTLGTTFTAPVVTNMFTATVTNGMEFTWDIVATNWWFDVYETQNGSVLAPEAGWMADGTNFVIEASPAEHYHFAGWTGDTNGCVAADGMLAVPMDRSRTIGAKFEKTAEYVSFTVMSEYGMPTPSVGQHFMPAGTVVTASVDSVITVGSTQYVCTGWTGTGNVYRGYSESTVFTLRENSTLTWNWNINYWMEILDCENGYIDVSSGWFPWWGAGEANIIHAIPLPHYHFVRWTGDVDGCEMDGSTLEVSMDKPRTIGAEFAIDEFDIKFESGLHGSVDGQAIQTLPYGNKAEVPAVVPNAGYVFSGWDGNVDAPVSSNAIFTAIYTPIAYTITYVNLKGAENPNTATYTVEDEINFIALDSGAVHGWEFLGWSPSCITTGTVGDVEVVANWKQTIFSVSVDGIRKEYPYGENVTFTAPSPIESDGTQLAFLGTTFTAPVVTNEFTLTVTGDVSFTWDIIATNWWFEVSETQNGFITAPEAGWMADGTNFTLVAVPDEHYHFAGWTGDTNGCVAADEMLELTMDQARTLGAWFEKDAFAVSFDAGVHGTISGVAALSVDYGATAAVPEVIPAAGYRFAGWSGDVSAPVTSNATFTAQYATVPYAITYTGMKGAANTNPETYTVEDEITFAAPGEVYGWVFKGWTPTSIAIGSTGAIEVSANWERQKFDVTVNGGTTQYDYEAEVTFTAPEPWDADGMQVVTLGTTFTDPVVTNEFTVTVTNGIEFAWDILATNWWFEASETQDGSITAPEAGWMADGTNFMLVAVPAEHYHFVGWTGDTNGCAVADGALEVTMDQARTIGAVFEIDDLPAGDAANAPMLAWYVGGDAGWHGVWTNSASDGVHAARSGTIGDNEESVLGVVLNGAGTLTFDWRTSCEERFDAVRLEIDGAAVRILSGETAWTNMTINLDNGEHDVRWVYKKGRSKTAGEDAAWIDNVIWTAAEAPTLADALGDFNWETEGDALWTALRSEYAYEGESFAIAEAPGDFGEAILRTTVPGEGRIVFRWAVSCEEGYDWFDFLVDGEVVEMTTGEIGWQTVSIDLCAGEHTLEWIYWKDELDEEDLVGADCAMLDLVQWYPKGEEPLAINEDVLEEFFSWLKSHRQLAADSDKSEALSVYENKTCATGKSSSLYDEFVAMTNPEDVDDVFKVDIMMVNGKPVLTPSPYCPNERKYLLYGKKTLSGSEEWHPIDAKDAPEYQFFKVMVDLP